VKLWLLRHAPVNAPTGLCYGATDLAAQTEPTQAAAAIVAPLLTPDVDLHCSPLQRCSALAGAIAVLRPELPPFQFDPRIAEMDFGEWEGRPWSAIDRADLDAWTMDFADARAGIHGESTRLFMQRVGAAWDAWRASGSDALWVTHAGVIRAVWLLHTGMRCPTTANHWPTRAIVFGELTSVEV
jgi:alpha-ribazole phosphatase